MKRESLQLVSIADTAKLLAVSTATLYRLIERGELHPVKVGRSTRLRLKDLQALYGDPELNDPNGGTPKVRKL